MSYDVSLEIDTGNGRSATAVDCMNYTSNMGYALPDGVRLGALDGKPAAQVASFLGDALAWIEANAEDLRKREPSNGWGSLGGWCRFLTSIRDACIRHPACTVRVWA